MSTIKDVAKQAGVSIATVSRVINNLGGYSEDTRLKVQKAIVDSNFIINEMARGLVANRSRLLGVMLPNLETDVWNKIVEGIEKSSYENDYMILLAHTGDSQDHLIESVERFIERKVEGVIFLSRQINQEIIDKLTKANIKFIVTGTFDDNVDGSDYPFLKIDDYQASIDGMSLLLEKGYCNPVMIGGKSDDFVTTNFRYQAFKDSLKLAGITIDPNKVFIKDFSFDFGQKVVEDLLLNQVKFDSIFCLSDEIALAAIEVLKINNIKVPDEVGILGFDDSRTSVMSVPKITTIHQPLYRMGCVAVNKVLEAINKNSPIETEILAHKLVIRESL